MTEMRAEDKMAFLSKHECPSCGDLNGLRGPAGKVEPVCDYCGWRQKVAVCSIDCARMVNVEGFEGIDARSGERCHHCGRVADGAAKRWRVTLEVDTTSSPECDWTAQGVEQTLRCLVLDFETREFRLSSVRAYPVK